MPFSPMFSQTAALMVPHLKAVAGFECVGVAISFSFKKCWLALYFVREPTNIWKGTCPEGGGRTGAGISSEQDSGYLLAWTGASPGGKARRREGGTWLLQKIRDCCRRKCCQPVRETRCTRLSERSLTLGWK